MSEFIVFDGIIGAGKSTLIARLLSYLKENMPSKKLALIDEPVGDWEEKGIIQKSYASPQVWNFPAQCYFFHSRIMQTRSVVEQNSDAQIFLSERSVFTDKLFWNVQKKQNRLGQDAEDGATLHETYLNMWNLWVELMPMMPTKFVYLRPSLNECMKRMNERAREFEKSGVSSEYQTALLEEHDQVFLNKEFVTLPNGTQIPIVNIETNSNFRDDDDELKRIAEQIFE